MAIPAAADDAVALVTGASSGIGADLARSLAARGHGVALVARRGDRLEELAAELADRHGVRAEAIAADLLTKTGRKRVVEALAEADLRVDVLVNNAGFGSAGLFQRLDGAREAQLVRLNCEVVVDLCGRFVPGMVERGSGAVLNVASVAGFQPLPTQATYAASKAFVLSFTQGLRADLHGTGVTATVLCPGPVHTEFGAVAGIGEEAKRVPEFAWVPSAEVAEAGVRGLESDRGVVVPGAVSKALSIGGQFTPRSILLGLGRRVYRAGDS